MRHSNGEYVRGDCGMKGTNQHCSEKHLYRYVAEFESCYSNWVKLGVDDGQRTMWALRGMVGRKLTCKGSPDLYKTN